VKARRSLVQLVGVHVPCFARGSSPETASRRRPPRRTSRCCRRLSTRVDSLFEFAIFPATSRAKPRVESCPVAQDRATPTRSPPLATASPELPAAAGSRFNGLDLIRPRVKPELTGQPYLFCKRAPELFCFHTRGPLQFKVILF
jgi:hypothetical protein